MADFKMRGKEALNRVSEFIGLKDKLAGICNKVKGGIADTDCTLSKIDAFCKGMREATQKVANTFRTFADKEEVDYSQKEQKFSKTELAKSLGSGRRRCMSLWCFIWMQLLIRWKIYREMKKSIEWRKSR